MDDEFLEEFFDEFIKDKLLKGQYEVVYENRPWMDVFYEEGKLYLMVKLYSINDQLFKHCKIEVEMPIQELAWDILEYGFHPATENNHPLCWMAYEFLKGKGLVKVV